MHTELHKDRLRLNQNKTLKRNERKGQGGTFREEIVTKFRHTETRVSGFRKEGR